MITKMVHLGISLKDGEPLTLEDIRNLYEYADGSNFSLNTVLDSAVALGGTCELGHRLCVNGIPEA